MSTSVLLAHPNTLLREGIASVLREGGFRVVGQADSVSDLAELITIHQAEVVLLDWELSDGGPEAIESLVSLAEKESHSVIVIISRPQPTETFLAAMRAGVGGYLSVNLSASEFIDAVRMLAKGNVVVSREMAADLKEELAAQDTTEPKNELTDREREVLGLVSRGATNREIAGSLTITENTVKVHLRRILDKLDLRNRQQAAAYAVQEGLVRDVVEIIDAPDTAE
jgi:DNA-binding NarL/FixJ family response regulator